MTNSTPGPRSPRAPRRRRVACALLVIALGAIALGAEVVMGELVLLNGGGLYKVRSFELEGPRVRLHLKEGGQVVLSMLRVDRILEDEFEPGSAEPLPEPPPSFSLRYHASQSPPEVPYGELIHQIAQRHSMNPHLVAAMTRAESAFQAAVVSHKGAQGLMQLMPATARRFGLRGDQVFDPARNLDAGIRYLRWLADRFDDRLAWVLAAYNAGEGTVDRYGGVPPYRETRGYIQKIYATLGLDARQLNEDLGEP